MYLTQSIHKGLQECPDATAIVYRDLRFSRAQLADRVARCGAVLKQLGLKPGDRVGMMALNSHRYVEFLFGTWWAGGVINPVNVRWSPAEVAYSLDDCDTQILFVDDMFKEIGAKLPGVSRSLKTLVYAGDGAVPDGMLGYEQLMSTAAPVADAGRSGNDLAAVMYTGGTTGLPKGVMLTQANLYINHIGAMGAVSRPPEGVGVMAAPLFHIAGVGLTLQLAMGLTKTVVVPYFEEVAVCEAVQKERGTEIFLVPTMIKRLIDHPRFPEYDMSSLGAVFYGAAPMDAALLAQAMHALPGAQFAQLYGMTELSPIVTALTHTYHAPEGPHREKLRSAGKPVPFAEVQIFDPQDNRVPNGTVGEICARGPMVMAGYWNKPEQTAQALRGGWMHTGDGGYMDDDGFVYVVDRMKDMIITGGENVYSSEVENAISDIPQVSMCAVIAVPDDQWGERVHAVIVLREGQTISQEEIIAYCRERIAGYKCPRSVEFRDEMPISPAGKLLKYKLREPYWAGRDRKVN